MQNISNQGRRKHQTIGGGGGVWGHWLPGALLDIDKGTQKVFPGNVGGGFIHTEIARFLPIFF